MPDNEGMESNGSWCKCQRSRVEEYLRSQDLNYARIGDWPAWHVTPYVAVWAIESLASPGWIGWWAISGDLPTDYISASDIDPPQHPRKAVRAIAERWLKLVETWKDGRDDEEIQIGGNRSRLELTPLLEKRARLLIQWTDDDSLWEE